MSKSNWLENQLGLYIFNAVVPDFHADVTYYFTLHSDVVAEGDAQDVNEVVYGGWARVPINRTAGEWLVSGGTVSNINDIVCPTCVSGSAVAKYGSIGRLVSGAGQILYKGPLSGDLIINFNGTPIISAGNASMTEN